MGSATSSGAGTIPAASQAEIHWLIIPAPGAAGNSLEGRVYSVGATVQYRLGGEMQDVEVTPDTIVVRPMPQLALDYFVTAEIHADDPMTQDVIEPAEPFTLGVRARNNGFGVARNVSIDSAQPRIIDNQQGLLIGFQIDASFVNDAPAQPSLLIGFGDINPQTSKVGRWIMETNLSGQFVDFSAQFTHADALGGQLTSLITAVNTHLLVKDVRVDVPGRDAVRDFLARDGDTLRVYESDSADTLVTDQSTAPQTSLTFSGTKGTLLTPVTAGMLYVQLGDPFNGTMEIRRVVRADGKLLPAENAWFSKSGSGGNTQHFFNLFDVNGGGQYRIEIGSPVERPQPPVLQLDLFPELRVDGIWVDGDELMSRQLLQQGECHPLYDWRGDTKELSRQHRADHDCGEHLFPDQSSAHARVGPGGFGLRRGDALL